MMTSTQWNGELIADLAPKRSALREPEMVCIRGAAAANQASLLGHELDVVPITNTARDWPRHRQECRDYMLSTCPHSSTQGLLKGKRIFNHPESAREVILGYAQLILR
jgi:hypothetical protein